VQLFLIKKWHNNSIPMHLNFNPTYYLQLLECDYTLGSSRGPLWQTTWYSWAVDTLHSWQ